jgi:hypothetical protein
MTIKVFRIEKGNKNRPTLIPGLLASSPAGSNQIQIPEFSVHYFFNEEIYQKASEIYVKSEVDNLITDVKKSIADLGTESSNDISSSLKNIQDRLIELKKDIIESRTLKDAIKKEILEELKTEGHRS